MDSGEFIVIVAAVDMLSHDGRPSLRSVASFSIRLYKLWIPGGAGTGPGRECAALMSDLRDGDSLDMAGNDEQAGIEDNRENEGLIRSGKRAGKSISIGYIGKECVVHVDADV
jgi:hypothetical protein